MEKVLIVSENCKETGILIEILKMIYCYEIQISKTYEESKKKVQEFEFDLCIINSQENNKWLESFAKELITKTNSQVLYLAQNDVFEYTKNIYEDIGIITIPKPIDINIALSTLNVIKILNKKIKKIEKENEKLCKQVQDIKLINRAKFILITHLNMNETEAHKYIEKESMNSRSTKIDVALKILKTYDN